MHNHTREFVEQNHKYKFETFLPYAGVENAYDICRSFGAAFRAHSSLLLMGRTGLGKTHLRYAAAFAILEMEPDLVVTAASAELLQYAIVENKKHYLEQVTNHTDLLLVEHLGFLEGKRGLQEVVADIFQAVDDRGGRVLVDEDENIASYTCGSRLAEFMRSCQILRVRAPTFTERKQLAHHLAMQYGLDIPDQVLTFVAVICWRNVREIEGAILRIKATLELYRPFKWPNSTNEARSFLGYPKT